MKKLASSSVTINYSVNNEDGEDGEESCKRHDIYFRGFINFFLQSGLHIYLAARTGERIGTARLNFNGDDLGYGQITTDINRRTEYTENVVFNQDFKAPTKQVITWIQNAVSNAVKCQFDSNGTLIGVGEKYQAAAAGTNFKIKESMCIETVTGEKILGNVQLTYKSEPTMVRWSTLNLQQENLGILTFEDGEIDTFTFTIDSSAPPDDEEEEGPEREISIRVVDISTEAPIEGAHVFVDNISRGYTNEEGKTELFTIEVGTYPLRIEKDGYLPSDEDQISNDEITVS